TILADEASMAIGGVAELLRQPPTGIVACDVASIEPVGAEMAGEGLGDHRPHPRAAPTSLLLRRQPRARRHGARQWVSVRADSLNADNPICDPDRELDRPPLDGETGACRPMVLREAAGDLLRAAAVPIDGERLDAIATHAVSGDLRELRQV